MQDVPLEELHAEAEQGELARDGIAKGLHAAAQVEVLLEIGGRDAEASLREALALLRTRRASGADNEADHAGAEDLRDDEPVAHAQARAPSALSLSRPVGKRRSWCVPHTRISRRDRRGQVIA